MEVNQQKSYIMFHRTMEGQIRSIKELLPFQGGDFQIGLKYLGFQLNLNEYGSRD